MSTTRTYIYRYSLPTSVQWQFSGIPPPPQLLTPNLFYPTSRTGEFSRFGPCSGLGALPQDSKPKYAYYCYQIKYKGELVNLARDDRLIITSIVFTGSFNSIQDYLYSAFHDTIIAKQLYRKLSFYKRCIYRINLIYLTYGNIWLILYIFWGVGIISS